MNNLREKIELYFGSDRVPNKDELVALNGFDELEKADAVKHFGDKSWETVYRHLAQGEFGWKNVRLEEWSSLEPYALRYFLRPYLVYLLDTLDQTQTDDEFVAYLFFQLSQVLRMRDNSVFDKRQKVLLAELAGLILATVEADPKFDIWRNDIKKNVNQCLSLLNTG